jgi:hypothetical protein
LSTIKPRKGNPKKTPQKIKKIKFIKNQKIGKNVKKVKQTSNY